MASSGVCSLSLPCLVHPAGGRDRAWLPLDLVVCCLSACGAVFRVLATWGPLLVPCSLCAPTTAIFSSFLGIFRGSSRGISSSHCWSLLNWRHLSVFRPTAAGDRSLSGLRAGDCGLTRLGMGGRLSTPPSGVVGCGNSCTLDALCIDRNFLSGQSWPPLLGFPLHGGFSGLVQIFSCLALSVPVGGLSDFSPADFSSLRLCLVDRIQLGYFLGGYDYTRVSFRS